MGFDLRLGDSREVLPLLGSEHVDALVTDPPAGISFMGKKWDHDHGGRAGWVAAFADIFAECLRVLKPGAHGLVWALPRTSHWTATALEDAGFEIRDVGVHLFGTGFPKSLDVSKAIDKAAGADREVVGQRDTLKGRGGNGNDFLTEASRERIVSVTAPATDLACQLDGWGTALKPAAEHWILVRKPLDGTVAANVAAHGTGALNIDACRLGVSETDREALAKAGGWARKGYETPERVTSILTGTIADGKPKDADYHPAGRWPANVTLDEEAAALLDQQSGDTGAFAPVYGTEPSSKTSKDSGVYGVFHQRDAGPFYGDSGGASRFFYVAKPDRGERDIGCEDLPACVTNDETPPGTKGAGNPRCGANRAGRARNIHPTVKSVDLMRWLCRLITPPGGLVLDPFMGSGSTGIACAREGMRFIGIERERAYFEIARRRIIGDAPLLNRIQVALALPEEKEPAA